MADLNSVYGKTPLVLEREGKYIEDSEKTITRGLCGCWATLLYTEKAGKKQGILTHYSPYDTNGHINHIELLVEKHSEMKEADIKKGVIIYEDYSSLSYNLESYKSDCLEKLESGIKDVLGEDTEIEKKEYEYSSVEKPKEVYFDLESSSWLTNFGEEGTFR